MEKMIVDEAAAAAKSAARPPRPGAAELAAFCAEIAADRKAEDIKTIQLSDLSVVADYFVVCTGNSEPHLKAIADRVGRSVLEKYKVRPTRVDGKPASQWLVIDYSNVIMHVFSPESRGLYQLDSLWADAPRVEDGGARREAKSKPASA